MEQGIDGVRKALVATVEKIDNQQKSTIKNINDALAARDRAITSLGDSIQQVKDETHKAIAANNKVVESNNATIARAMSDVRCIGEKQRVKSRGRSSVEKQVSSVAGRWSAPSPRRATRSARSMTNRSRSSRAP